MATSPRLDELKKKFDENPRRYFAPLANEYRKLGDLTQAVALCRAHLPNQPGHISGHIVLAQALYESRELGEARGFFEAALDLDPENLIALRFLGDIAREQGEPEAARTWYERVLEADPRNEEIADLLQTLNASAVAASPVESEFFSRPTPPAGLPPGYAAAEYGAAEAESAVATPEATPVFESFDAGEQFPLVPAATAPAVETPVESAEETSEIAESISDDWFSASSTSVEGGAPPAPEPSEPFSEGFFPDLSSVTPRESPAISQLDVPPGGFDLADEFARAQGRDTSSGDLPAVAPEGATETSDVLSLFESPDEPVDASLATPAAVDPATLPTPPFLAAVDAGEIEEFATPSSLESIADPVRDFATPPFLARVDDTAEPVAEPQDLGIEYAEFIAPAPEELATDAFAGSDDVVMEYGEFLPPSDEEMPSYVATSDVLAFVEAPVAHDEPGAIEAEEPAAFDQEPEPVAAADAPVADAGDVWNDAPFNARAGVAELDVIAHQDDEVEVVAEVVAEEVEVFSGLAGGSEPELELQLTAEIDLEAIGQEPADTLAEVDFDTGAPSAFDAFMEDEATVDVSSGIDAFIRADGGAVADAAGTDGTAEVAEVAEATDAAWEGETGAEVAAATDAVLGGEVATEAAQAGDARLEIEGAEGVEVGDRGDGVIGDAVAAPSSAAGFVTETMAELYLQQGFTDEALAIYRQLQHEHPDDAAIAGRIAALERGAASSVLEGHAAADRAGQSVRAFFAHFARRVPRSTRPARTTPDAAVAADSAADTWGERAAVDSYPGAARREEALTVPDEPPATLTDLFGGDAVASNDESAAAQLASAFGADPGHAGGYDAQASGRSGDQELSLEHLFRDVPARSSGAVTLDEFYAEASDAAAPRGSARAEGGDGQDADIEQFTAWLEGLKKK